MNSEQIKGKWNQIKGNVKQKYGVEMNDDETFSEGKFDEVVGKIQEKTGKAKEDIKKEIASW
ncbi:CsbD family protein [Marixanthomonas sp. SCSIO 43207]|uniref:CsbD family protein n=1 Tax=Marixanthomonas sp. SCSIO 43207 TaxID=2779360 RepID=UPI001CA8867F|nr:CsbD family protein [Marixanthomonas sp. SCSIO 43207]UAB81146.1 CsbD family protein [Marixanthomonas sp. SCSIO 43207]